MHKGFKALDTVPHILTELIVADVASVQVIEPSSIPNPNWLRPGAVGAGQQAFGDALLAAHKFVVFPSVVSTHSWNLVFVAAHAADGYALKSLTPFALDPRLHPPAP